MNFLNFQTETRSIWNSPGVPRAFTHFSRFFCANSHSQACCQRTGRSWVTLPPVTETYLPLKDERFRSRILFKPERVPVAPKDRTSSTVLSVPKMKLHNYLPFRVFPSSTSHHRSTHLSIEYFVIFRLEKKRYDFLVFYWTTAFILMLDIKIWKVYSPAALTWIPTLKYFNLLQLPRVLYLGMRNFA